ncbi:peptidase inhibitor family I36 protein [Actinoplanes sp. NPDC000266]
MKKSTALKGALGSLLAVAATTAVASSPAEAVYDCRTGEVCFYHDQNYRGTVAVIAGFAYKGAKVNDFRNFRYTNGQNLNDSVSSIRNLTSFTLRVHEHGTWGGKWIELKPGQSEDLYNSYETPLSNDSASSAQLK